MRALIKRMREQPVKTSSVVPPGYWDNWTGALLTMMATALAIMAVTYLVYYPGGLVAWIAGVLVATSQTTGISDFSALYAGFAASVIIMLLFFLYVVWVIFPRSTDWQERLADDYDEGLDLTEQLQELARRVEYLYEREACREAREDCDRVEA